MSSRLNYKIFINHDDDNYERGVLKRGNFNDYMIIINFWIKYLGKTNFKCQR